MAPDRLSIGIDLGGSQLRGGLVSDAPNLDGKDVSLRDEIESAFGLPTYADDDVRSAAWGEYAGHGSRGSTVMSRGVRMAVAALGDSAGIFGAADRVWLHV